MTKISTPIGYPWTYSLVYNSTYIQRSDGATIPDNSNNIDYQAYLAWVAEGNTATAASAPAAPVPSAYLWQLQAALTPSQWAGVQAAVVAANNPALTAFAATGNVPIPATSTTLLALGAAIGLSPAQVTALVTTASAIAIP